MVLRKRAQEQQDADAKRRREALEEQRLAAKDAAETQLLQARAQQAAAEARFASMRQIIINRRDAERRKHEELVERTFQRWLQTEYPARLARNLRTSMRKYSAKDRAALEREITTLLRDQTRRRHLIVKDLWSSDKHLTSDWSRIVPFNGGQRRSVRCGAPFQQVVDDIAPRDLFSVPDAVQALFGLVIACVPCARRLFTDAYAPLRLLHVNDYVLEKAFVYGIVALSKWLGQ